MSQTPVPDLGRRRSATEAPPRRAAVRASHALLTPAWVGRLVALLGVMTVLSAALPAFHDRLSYIAEVLPPVFPAAATTGALAAGTLLILLSRALRRGKRRAWILATVLVASTVVLHLLKGLDVEEAVAATAMLVLLLAARRNFRARPDPRSLTRAGGLLVVGTGIGTALGWLWLTLTRHDQAVGTGAVDRLVHALLGLVGIPGPVVFANTSDRDQAAVALSVLGAGVLIVVLLALLQPADGPHPMDADELRRVRTLVEDWGHVDSLSYFATRGDRSAALSRTGKAAVTYRVLGTVSLAAGDPVGDPEAWPGAIEKWLAEAESFGWVPAVLGASERGAHAFRRFGLDALEIGDEAVLPVEEFSLDGRSMRGVRQAVSRCRREGLTARCVPVRELDDEELAEVRAQAQRWREGPVERGFSMALGRIADRADPDNVLVLCRDREGRLRGILGLVPWGRDGLSLDLMRRDPAAVNGVVELMVTSLAGTASALGVEQISLNFAMFRSVFARGERLGAGPVLRAWYAVLLTLSRHWQIESLYRANAKFHPAWEPRFLCFRRPGDLMRVATAALRVEAFLVVPEWLRPR